MTPKAERHVAAIVELLRAELPAGVPVGMGVAPSNDAPYVTVLPDSGDIARDRLCGERANLVMRFDVEATGAGAEQALWVLDQARAALLGVRLVVDGYVVAPIEQIDGSMLRHVRVLQPPVYEIDAEFRLFSQAVAA